VILVDTEKEEKYKTAAAVFQELDFDLRS